MNLRIPFRALSWVVATAVVVLVAACASIPPPTDAMNQAKSGLQAAKKAGAPDADPVDVEFARSKYRQAQAAMTAGKNALAADLAHESIADSQLALTKARLATLRGQIRAQNKENARLRKQLLDRQAAAQATVPPPSEPATEELPETVLPSASSAPAPASSSAGATQEGQ